MRAVDLLACDVAVVGAGPAGLAAALRSAALGLRVVLVTRSQPGGRLRAAQRIPVVPGLPMGLTGGELVQNAVKHAERLGVRVVRGEVTGFSAEGRARRLVLAGGETIAARAVVAATGAERCTRHVEGAGRLLGAGVHTRGPGAGEGGAGGREAFVVGEPDQAARAALELSGTCERVTLVLAEAGGARTLSREVRAELRGCVNVTALPATAVVAAEGVDRLEVVVLRDARRGRLRARTASSLWLLGTERARTEWLPATVERETAGRLVTGGHGRLPSETAMACVFAAGDTRSGAPSGLAALEDGIDTAEQVSARLRLEGADEA